MPCHGQLLLAIWLVLRMPMLTGLRICLACNSAAIGDEKHLSFGAALAACGPLHVSQSVGHYAALCLSA